MPVLASTDNIAPKSILRHRPIAESTPPPGKRSKTTSTPPIQRASRAHPTTNIDDAVREWKQVDDQQKAPARRSTVATKTLPDTPDAKAPLIKQVVTRYSHPLLYLGLGMVAMLVLWILLSAALGWFTTTLDDIHYGRPRTFQTDAWVGHGEQSGIPSHFIAINLNRHIEIIEIPGGDATHARIYVGPQLFGAGDELVPVTLQFIDVNGDHKPDMVINVQGSRIVYINDQGGFRPMLPAEHRQVEQFLQHLGS